MLIAEKSKYVEINQFHSFISVVYIDSIFLIRFAGNNKEWHQITVSIRRALEPSRVQSLKPFY